MPNYDVHAKHHFFMPNHFKKGQISGIWPQKCQPGNPDTAAELHLYFVIKGNVWRKRTFFPMFTIVVLCYIINYEAIQAIYTTCYYVVHQKRF